LSSICPAARRLALETRLDPPGRLSDADPAFADILQRGLGDIVRPKPGGVGPAIRMPSAEIS